MGEPTLDSLTIGAIDDHPALLYGLGAALADLLTTTFEFVCASTVKEFLKQRRHCDVVLLDLSLGDDSVAADNVRALTHQGYPVLIYTQEHRPRPVARALLAGAEGVVLKNQPIEDLSRAIERAVLGEPYLSPDWAAALESEVQFHAPQLSPRELETLQLYATGIPLKSVARAMNITQDTARMYLLRVRSKYGQLGRGVGSRTDYYIRAVEDGHLPPPETT
jgi:DNA-binding NarL/FixJ family response regulator